MPTPHAEYLLKARRKPTPPNRRDEEPAPRKWALTQRDRDATRVHPAAPSASYRFHPKGGVPVEAHQTVGMDDQEAYPRVRGEP